MKKYQEDHAKWKDFKTQVENSLKTFKKQLEAAKLKDLPTGVAESKVEVAQDELDDHMDKKPEKPGKGPKEP